MNILNETQEQRDKELSVIMDVQIDHIEKIQIASPESICIFDHLKHDYPTEYYEYEYLYKFYEDLDLIAYLKTLMYTSVYKRGKHLKSNLDLAKGKCLDFGSGVGTHTIYLIQRKCDVDMLDVPGRLLNFAFERLKYRNLLSKLRHVKLMSSSLMDNHYDYINCLDVLEHCFNPLEEIKTIHRTLKKDGILNLQVSEMIKPSSGHFKESIEIWKNEGKQFLYQNFKKYNDFGVYVKK
jgi:2-polyprenyl-3-methyl-5-hydroxy-6-metoxy-1,4-benzoquinol methylase